MSDEQQEILQALHDHDRRLVKVETELHGLHREVSVLRTQLAQLIGDVGSLSGGQKIILAIISIGVPLIAGLQIWGALGG